MARRYKDRRASTLLQMMPPGCSSLRTFCTYCRGSANANAIASAQVSRKRKREKARSEGAKSDDGLRRLKVIRLEADAIPLWVRIREIQVRGQSCFRSCAVSVA